MRLQRQSSKEPITLDPASPLGVGGEACIYAVPQYPWLVAKIYHKPTDERARKLAVMLANPPEDPMAAQGRISIAWPVDFLCSVDGKNQIMGFLMPLVTGMRSILDFYNPSARRNHCPLFNYLYLHRAARNLAAAVCALHERGYVIGDVNESNVFVSDTALVALVDTDSFQVHDPHSRNVYRCTVGKPEFTPPELQGKTFADIDRTQAHDRFGLAVLIFQLLMEGTHPFAGIFQGEGDPPSYQERISAGHFPYSRRRRVPYLPSLIAPSFKVLHPTLRKLFVRCFRDGRRRPRVRPDAQVWKNALNDAENALVTCSNNDQHYYGHHLKTCPWCERSALLGDRDPFPSRESVESGQHLQPIPTIQKPLTPAGQKDTTPPTPTKTSDQLAPVQHNFWTWTVVVLALLSAFMLANDRLLLPRWSSLVCGVATVVWYVVGWYQVKMPARRCKWLARAALGIGTAAVLALLLISVLTGQRLTWWSLLASEAVLCTAALICGVINWRRVRTLTGYGKWLSGAALGMAAAALALVLLFLASLIAEDRLPWWLSLVWGVVLGTTALILGVAGWRQVQILAGRNKWIVGIALGVGTAVILVSMLTLLEVFMLASGRLYLTTLVCILAVVPEALVYGVVGCPQMRSLAREDGLWSLGAGFAFLVIFMLACGQLIVAALVYAVVILGTTALACTLHWQKVETLAGHGRWVAGAILGIGAAVAMLVLLFVALRISGDL